MTIAIRISLSSPDGNGRLRRAAPAVQRSEDATSSLRPHQAGSLNADAMTTARYFELAAALNRVRISSRSAL